MDYSLYKTLQKWPKPFIQSYALQHLMKKEGAAYYSAVSRALKNGLLIRIRRGLYRIDERMVSLFELAQELHGPSFISLESALSYHGWIPEAVYTTTSTCIRRSVEISTPLGLFSYSAGPIDHFYLGVERCENEDIFLIASPWRAVADLIHVERRNWNSLNDLCGDLRIEQESIWNSDVGVLEDLVKKYPNCRVRNVLNKFLKSLGDLSANASNFYD